ncbi:DUF1642 domain-containing protein [Lacticaseibacillus paracasei]|jgi:hypothetical protein|uniref:DUF1642 domain-containing protein n=1 Tax=Lacticaseibacillus paracasei TaxID=1597 RepID=UPI0022224814|nr:DUF1642 domain-containing protein [Lacticaseibacillus paracasei]
MSNETKRDVFVDAVDALADAQASGGNIGHQDANLFMAEYEKALPDDLPVIPKEVGEWLKNCKHDECDLVDAIVSSVNSIITSRRVTCWMEDHFDTFARAWLLGVWRVEETGEIVKLEAEK